MMRSECDDATSAVPSGAGPLVAHQVPCAVLIGFTS
jgi:hypothetical protein